MGNAGRVWRWRADWRHPPPKDAMLRLASLGTVALALLAAPSPADAQRNCRKGKPCGNSGIARDKLCRIDSTDAVGHTRPAPKPAVTANRPSRSRTVPHPVGPTVACAIARDVDGDTVDCAGGPRVRLLMIDAPERDQGPYGAAATRALRHILPAGTSATLELDVQQRDRYGRLLAYVYTPDGRMANEEMVREGYALLFTYPPNVRYVERIRAAQEDASAGGRGLWSTSAFECPPAAHRRRAC